MAGESEHQTSWPLAGDESPVHGADADTQQRLLEATERLVERHGIRKTSMGDVARAAGVARGTLYRHFESREALLNAWAQRNTDRFYADVAAAMDRQSTLSEQLGEFSERMIRVIHPEGHSPAVSRSTLARLLGQQGTQALRRTARFLRSYIEAARDRGEVRADLDVVDASEWLARILLSFTVFQASVAYEPDDPRSVRAFVQRYAIRGLDGN